MSPSNKLFNLSVVIVASFGFVSATVGDIVTVGFYDEDINNGNTVDIVAGGSTLTLSETKALVADAFANDLGGTWDLDTDVAGEWDGTGRTSFTLSYGAAQTDSIIFNLDNNFARGTAGTITRAISGDQYGAGSTNANRIWTPSESLTMIAITHLARGSFTTMGGLSVTLQDSTVLSTTATAGNIDGLHVITASASNPIVSFTMVNNGFTRWDDLAFSVAVPEPSSSVLMVVAAVGFAITRKGRVGLREKERRQQQT